MACQRHLSERVQVARETGRVLLPLGEGTLENNTRLILKRRPFARSLGYNAFYEARHSF
jgi:hypothetical protein